MAGAFDGKLSTLEASMQNKKVEELPGFEEITGDLYAPLSPPFPVTGCHPTVRNLSVVLTTTDTAAPDPEAVVLGVRTALDTMTQALKNKQPDDYLAGLQTLPVELNVFGTWSPSNIAEAFGLNASHQMKAGFQVSPHVIHPDPAAHVKKLRAGMSGNSWAVVPPC